MIEDLRLAQQEREDRVLLAEIDARLDVLLSHADVSPQARNQLRQLLKHYAKNPHPFRACVRDNMKRFGPGRTERICATVKDMIRGTHKWRDGGGGIAASAPEIGEEATKILLSLPDDELDKIVLRVKS